MTRLTDAEPPMSAHRLLERQRVSITQMLRVADMDRDDPTEAVTITVPFASAVVAIKRRDHNLPEIDLYYEGVVYDLPADGEEDRRFETVEIHAVHLQSPHIPKYSHLIGHVEYLGTPIAIYARTTS